MDIRGLGGCGRLRRIALVTLCGATDRLHGVVSARAKNGYSKLQK